MNWYHEVSLEWLKERQKYLTASDIKDLLPVTATGRKRTVTNKDYLKVWARKQKYLTRDDCITTGAAARGHLLEPYAIEEFNKMQFSGYMYHWDDKIVYNGSLAFSPDALNINRDGQISYRYDEIIDAGFLAEIKSYNIESHYLKAVEDKENLEERWQAATAFAVCPQLQEGYLILFNPSCNNKLFIHQYSRQDLKDEIQIVKKISKDYKEYCTNALEAKAYSMFSRENLEEEIIKDIEAKQKLNPGR